MKREAVVVQARMKALSPSPPINPINMDIQTPSLQLPHVLDYMTPLNPRNP